MWTQIEFRVKSSKPMNSPVLLHSTFRSFTLISSQCIPLTPLQPLLVISCSMCARFWCDMGLVVLAACLYCLIVSQAGIGQNTSNHIVSPLVTLTSYQTAPFNNKRIIPHSLRVWLLITFS